MNARQIRGYSILAKGDNPQVIDKETFLIPSQSGDKKYKVLHKQKWTCDCPDFVKRGIECKHIHTIKFWLKMRDKLEIDDLNIDTKDENCIYCKSVNIVKNGIRKTKTGNRQRYKCKECKRKFVLEPLKHVKGNGKIVSLTMDLYFKGLSLRDISDTLYQFYGLRIHFDTVRRWIRKYTKIMNEYTNTLKPELGKKWNADEQKIKSGKNWVWSWNVLDNETRFLIANNVTKSRYIDDAKKVFNKAKELGRPETIITDGLWSYDKAIKKEFTGWWRNDTKLNHIRNAGVRKKINNNMVERYHNEFREFDKTA